MLRFVKRFTPTFRSLLKTGSRGDQELNFQEKGSGLKVWNKLVFERDD